MRGLAIVSLSTLLAAVPCGASNFHSSGRATTTAAFLKIGAGARAAGMGEAYSAVVDEASALYWNPAALTRISSHSLTLMHADYLGASDFEYASYARNLGRFGAWGASFQYFTANAIAQTDAAGAENGTFIPADTALTLGYALSLPSSGFSQALGGASLGVAGKYIRSSIATTAQAAAVDLGLLSPPYLNGNLRLAFTLTNLGTKVQFDQASEWLPVELRAGASYRLQDRFTAGLDLGLPNDNQPFVAAGLECLVAKGKESGLLARAGFNSRTLGDVDGFTGVAFGIGVVHAPLAIDYAMVPFGSLGLTHRLSVSFRW